MTRIFTEGFEAGDGLFWSTLAGATSTAQARSGSRSWSLTNVSPVKNVTAVAEGFFRFGLRISSYSAAAWTVLQWRAGATVLGSLRINSSTKKLELYTGASTLVATGTTAIAIDTWYLIELRIKIADAGGVVEAKLDGTVEPTFTGDTKPGADTTFDNLIFTAMGASITLFLDDLAFNDTAGGVDDGYCGDGHVVMLTPNANGDSSQLVGSDADSTDNYLLVDEVPKDDDTTYVESATATQYDLYNLSAYTLQTGEAVLRLFVEARVKETTAAGDSINLGVKSGVTESWSGNLPVTTAYARYVGADLKTDPDTAAAWTQAGLNALQAGVKIV